MSGERLSPFTGPPNLTIKYLIEFLGLHVSSIWQGASMPLDPVEFWFDFIGLFFLICELEGRIESKLGLLAVSFGSIRFRFSVLYLF